MDLTIESSSRRSGIEASFLVSLAIERGEQGSLNKGEGREESQPERGERSRRAREASTAAVLLAGGEMGEEGGQWKATPLFTARPSSGAVRTARRTWPRPWSSVPTAWTSQPDARPHTCIRPWGGSQPSAARRRAKQGSRSLNNNTREHETDENAIISKQTASHVAVASPDPSPTPRRPPTRCVRIPRR